LGQPFFIFPKRIVSCNLNVTGRYIVILAEQIAIGYKNIMIVSCGDVIKLTICLLSLLIYHYFEFELLWYTCWPFYSRHD